MNGEYKEKLPSGKGELIVSNNSWRIEYYFPGPDYRYTGTWLKITGDLIDKYIEAFEKNWEKYKSLKETISSLKGEMKIEGEMKMTIYVGGHFDGVCIESYHMPLKTEEEIKTVIADYFWAKQRGPEVVNIMNQLK